MSRAFRAPRASYVPPHLRSSGAGGAPRSLDDLASTHLQVRVQYTRGGPFSFDDCPDTVELEEGAGPATTAPRSAGTAEAAVAAQPVTEAAGKPPAQAAGERAQATAEPGEAAEGSTETSIQAIAEVPSDGAAEAREEAAAETTAEQAAQAGDVSAEPPADTSAGPPSQAAEQPTNEPTAEAASPAAVDPAAWAIGEPGGASAEPGSATSATSAQATGQPAAQSVPEPASKPEADAAGAPVPSPPNPMATALLTSPNCPDSFQIQQLLKWFQTAAAVPDASHPAGDVAAVLILPPSLTKQQRAEFHGLAQKLGLHTQSQGIGAERFLSIRPAATTPAPAAARPPMQPELPAGACTSQPVSAATAEQAADADASAPGQAASSSTAQPHAAAAAAATVAAQKRSQVTARAKEIWLWCQREGSIHYSQGEIAEMLASEAGLTPDIKALVERRKLGRQLALALQRGQEDAALALLPQDSKVAWVRDDESGGYPAHIAAYRGFSAVVRELVKAGGLGVLQQRDASGKTPIYIAQRRGHKALVEELQDMEDAAHQPTAATGRGFDPSRRPNAAEAQGGSGTLGTAAVAQGSGEQGSAAAAVAGAGGADRQGGAVGADAAEQDTVAVPGDAGVPATADAATANAAVADAAAAADTAAADTAAADTAAADTAAPAGSARASQPLVPPPVMPGQMPSMGFGRGRGQPVASPPGSRALGPVAPGSVGDAANDAAAGDTVLLSVIDEAKDTDDAPSGQPEVEQAATLAIEPGPPSQPQHAEPAVSAAATAPLSQLEEPQQAASVADSAAGIQEDAAQATAPMAGTSPPSHTGNAASGASAAAIALPSQPERADAAVMTSATPPTEHTGHTPAAPAADSTSSKDPEDRQTAADSTDITAVIQSEGAQAAATPDVSAQLGQQDTAQPAAPAASAELDGQAGAASRDVSAAVDAFPTAKGGVAVYGPESEPDAIGDDAAAAGKSKATLSTEQPPDTDTAEGHKADQQISTSTANSAKVAAATGQQGVQEDRRDWYYSYAHDDDRRAFLSGRGPGGRSSAGRGSWRGRGGREGSMGGRGAGRGRYQGQGRHQSYGNRGRGDGGRGMAAVLARAARDAGINEEVAASAEPNAPATEASQSAADGSAADLQGTKGMKPGVAAMAGAAQEAGGAPSDGSAGSKAGTSSEQPKVDPERATDDAVAALAKWAKNR